VFSSLLASSTNAGSGDRYLMNKLFKPAGETRRTDDAHGSSLSIRKFNGFHDKLVGDGKRQRMKVHLEIHNASKNADRVLWIAFGANLADTCIKGCVAYITGSKSIFAETIHNAMDTLNQGILIFGSYISKRKPDSDFPYGYGNVRYIASLISGVGILSFGCGVSVFNGISGILQPDYVLESLPLAYISLALSACFQITSFTAAVREVKKNALEAHENFFTYVRTSADPTINVILCEDSAALIGVCLAFSSVSLSHYFSSPVCDSVGSILIGALLGTAALYIIRTNAINLMGRSLPERRREQIVRMLRNDFVVKGIHDVKATSIGVNKYSFKAEIDYGGKEITRVYLQENCDMKKMLERVQSLKNEKELEVFMMEHGEKIVDRVGDEVDRIEMNIRRSNPDIGHIDLEPS